MVKNPLKKAARGRKRAKASQLANAAKKRRDKARMWSMRDEPVEVTEDPAASSRRASEDSEARMTQTNPPQLGEPTDPETRATTLSLTPPSASVTRAPVTCRLCGALGHNRRTCPQARVVPVPVAAVSGAP